MYFNKILVRYLKKINCYNIFFGTMTKFVHIFLMKIICYSIFFFFFSVVGEREKSSNTVNVRTRDNIVHGEFPVSEVIEKFKILKQQRLPDSANVF